MEEKSNDIPLTLKGNHALELAREISKLPGGDFHIVFFPYSRAHGTSSAKLRTIEHCKWRTQLPQEAFDIDPDNYFLFSDRHGDPKMCYRILIRYMAFPTDGYVLHPVKWLE